MINLKQVLVIGALVFTVFGCSKSNSVKESDFFKEYKYQCIDGKKYLQYYGFGDRSGITIVLDDDGKPIKCQ